MALKGMSLRTASIQLAFVSKPELRAHLVRLLVADVPVDEEDTAKGKGHSGPPPMWKEFLDAEYEGGKRKVPNTNSKTRKDYPQVAVSTLLKSDKTFYGKVYKEYLEWKSKQKDPDAKGEPKPKDDDPKGEPKKEEPKKPVTKKDTTATIDKFKAMFEDNDNPAHKFYSAEGKKLLKEYQGLVDEIGKAGDDFDYAGAITKLEKLAPRLGDEVELASAQDDGTKDEEGGGASKPSKKEAPKSKFPSIKLKEDRFKNMTLEKTLKGQPAKKDKGQWAPSEVSDFSKKVITAFAGKGKSLQVHDIADMIGATGLKGSLRIHSFDSPWGIGVQVAGLNINNMRRILKVDENGDKVIFNDTLVLESEAPKGLGTKLLANEVAQAKAAGVKRIECHAFRSGVADKWVGYKVWPKLGYDGPVPFDNDDGDNVPPLPKALKDKIKKAGFREPVMVSHLYQVEGGMEWWEENGQSFHATLDLADDSYSMRVLSNYINKKAEADKQDLEEWVRIAAARIAAMLLAGKKDDKKDEPKGKVPKKVDEKHRKEYETIDLDEDDHKILDAYFKRLRDERKAKHPG